MKKQPVLLTQISLLVCLFILLPTHVFAWANPNLLMTIDEVERAADKPDWVILDCRDKKSYDAGHIPGAVTLGGACRYILRDGTERIKPATAMEKMLGDIGISNDKHIVVYSDAEGFDLATTGFWILEYLGHDKVYFLDGGITAWKKAEKPVSKDLKKLPPASFKAKVVSSRLATTEEILKVVKEEITGSQLIDSRSKKEHTGEDVRSLRGGRIPKTTINIPHDITYDKKSGKLFPEEQLSLMYKHLNKDKRTIAYCQTGARSTTNYLELRLLGFKDPAVYDDSWVVYGNSIYPPYPIEDEQWINLDSIGKMKKAMDKMAKEMIELKKEITQLKRGDIETEAAEEAWMNPLEESGCGMAEEE